MISPCGTEIEGGKNFCGHCETDITVETLSPNPFCGECGSAVLNEYEFCPDCGASLNEGSTPTAEKQKSKSIPKMQTPDRNDKDSESPRTIASKTHQKHKKKRGVKLVIFIIIAYALIITSVFCYFYICLHGLEAVPFVDYMRFLPFAGN